MIRSTGIPPSASRGPSVAIALLVLGCGRIHFDPLPDDGSLVNDAFVTPACRTWGAFGDPIHVPELSTPADESAVTLTADNLSVVFDSTRAPSAGGDDLFFASRTDASLPFGMPGNLTMAGDHQLTRRHGRGRHLLSDPQLPRLGSI